MIEILNLRIISDKFINFGNFFGSLPHLGALPSVGVPILNAILNALYDVAWIVQLTLDNMQ